MQQALQVYIARISIAHCCPLAALASPTRMQQAFRVCIAHFTSLKTHYCMTAYLAPACYRQHSLAASGRQLLTPLAVLGCHTCGAADFICKSVVSMLALRWLENYSMLSREPGNLGWVRKHCLAFIGWSQRQCFYAIFAHKY